MKERVLTGRELMFVTYLLGSSRVTSAAVVRNDDSTRIMEKFLIPRLENFSGTIREVIRLNGGNALTVRFNGYRHCFNIGRYHRNNGIYFVFDLVSGYFWQKCYDAADCPSYEGPKNVIDEENLSVLRNHFLSSE
jgi:hypothetical protein